LGYARLYDHIPCHRPPGGPPIGRCAGVVFAVIAKLNDRHTIRQSRKYQYARGLCYFHPWNCPSESWIAGFSPVVNNISRPLILRRRASAGLEGWSRVPAFLSSNPSRRLLRSFVLRNEGQYPSQASFRGAMTTGSVAWLVSIKHTFRRPRRTRKASEALMTLFAKEAWGCRIPCATRRLRVPTFIGRTHTSKRSNTPEIHPGIPRTQMVLKTVFSFAPSPGEPGFVCHHHHPCGLCPVS